MEPNSFVGKKEAPTDDEVSAALGVPVKDVWDRLIGQLKADHGVDTCEWHSYSPKAGWFIRARRGKRNIAYMSPCPGFIRVSFILGPKAMAAARETKLPKKVIAALDEAPKYPEGFGIRLEFKSARELPGIGKLAAIKIAH